MIKLGDILFRIRHGVPAGHQYFSGSWHGGSAQFTYLPSEDNQKLLDGYMCYHINYGNGRYAKAEGTFYKNLKDGRWQYRQRRSTVQRSMTLSFSGGKVSGTVDFQSREFDLSSTVQNSLQFSVLNGVVTGNIVGMINGCELKGYCDDQGFADGEWTLSVLEDNAVRYVNHELWSHGTLQSSYEEDLLRKKRLDKPVKVSSRFDLILDQDIPELLHIVTSGSENHVKFHRAEK